jgi:hypothetical protein
MPAALERKLKKQAADDPSIKDKDAYVYGTLRKTGWKPSREKKKSKKMEDPTDLVTAENRLKNLEFQLGQNPTAGGHNPTKSGVAAGQNPVLQAAKRKAGIGNVSNEARALATAPKGPGLSGAANLAGKAGAEAQSLKRLLTPQAAAKLAIFKSAEDTLEFGALTEVGEAIAGAGQDAQKFGPKAKKVLAKAAGVLGATAGTAGQYDLLSSKLDKIIEFAYEEDDHPLLKAAGVTAVGGGAAAAGVGGTLLHQAVQRAGGYGASLEAAKKAFPRGVTGKGLQNITAGPGRTVGQALGKVWGAVKPLFHEASAKEPATIRFAVDRTELTKQGSINPHVSEHILEPWQGVMAKGKIPQEQFPAGPNPHYAPWAKNLSREEFLKLPLAAILRFIKPRRPQILQQDFPGFSSRIGKLIELSSKLDEINTI